MKPGQPVNVNLKATTAVVNQEGHHVFQEGVVLRKVSRFVIGAQEDGIIPVPVFFDPKTGKILIELLHPELRAEYAKIQGEEFPAVENGAKTEE